MTAIPPVTPDATAALSQDASKSKLKKVAQQFEGIFLQELFKGLEHEPEEGDLFGDSQASQMFNQLHHQALSDKAAGGMGIADMMYQELAVKAGIKTGIKTTTPVTTPATIPATIPATPPPAK